MTLDVHQPTLSRLLAEAEARLGGRVFDRPVQGSSPTTLGKLILAQARFVLQGIQRLEDATSSGITINLGCIPRATHSIIPRLLNRITPPPGRSRAPSSLFPFRLNVKIGSASCRESVCKYV